MSLLPSSFDDLPTPCLLVDLDIVKKNTESMIQKCKSLGVKLRHMTKTHKCIEAGVLATGGTKRGISCSTLAEAEFFADNGFDDILVTCLVSPDKINRLTAMLTRLDTFHVMLDNQVAVDLLEEAKVDNKKWSVLLAIDTGNEREGMLWDDEDTVKLAERLSKSSNITLQGLYSHEGHSYDTNGPDEIKEIGSEATERIIELATKLGEMGIVIKDVGLGATPSSSLPSDNMKQLTELHPGNYVFYDSMQSCLGSCNIDSIAVRVAARVIGHYPHRNQMIVDAGFLAMSSENKDRKGISNGSICLVQDHANLRLVKMSQEHGMVEGRKKIQYEKYPIGTMLFFYPFHSCATCACYKEYYVHEGDNIITTWKPCSGW